MPKPTQYSQKTGRNICARIAEGEALDDICRDISMPEKRTVLGWLSKRADFHACYARARELRADALFDEILAIADDKGPAGAAGAGENAQRARLRVEARKWVLARLAPRKYGDKPGAGDEEDERSVVIQVITGVPRRGD